MAETMPDLTRAQAITLLNPWAHAILHAGKRVENRRWIPNHGIGWLYLHAGKGWDDAGMARLAALGVDLNHVRTGAIVALAELTGVCAAWLRREPCGCGEWAVAGQYHWQLGAVWNLPTPVLCRGLQKLWIPGPDVVAAVREQLDQITITADDYARWFPERGDDGRPREDGDDG